MIMMLSGIERLLTFTTLVGIRKKERELNTRLCRHEMKELFKDIMPRIAIKCANKIMRQKDNNSQITEDNLSTIMSRQCYIAAEYIFRKCRKV
jgi:hypothetical protein